MDERHDSEVEVGGIWVPRSAKLPESEATSAGDEATAPSDDSAADVEAAANIDYKDRYLRALADLDNIRRRTAEQSRQAVQRANEDFLLRLLPLIDGFERALAGIDSDVPGGPLEEGVVLLQRQFAGFLEQVGVTALPCERGDEFDPEIHDAMMRAPATAEVAEGHVLEVYERGYRLFDRVLRPARVVVAAEPLDAQA